MFREARLGDFDAVLRLYRQLNPDDRDIDVDAGSAIFQKIIENPGLHLFVLECDDVVVASTYLNVIPNLTRSASPYAVVENVVVEKSRRSTGLGKQIMADTLEFAWAAGCYKAMLMTGSKRQSTHGF